MKILVTGARGFIGKNLAIRLCEKGAHEVIPFVRGDAVESLESLVAAADAVVHLAGENRPREVEEFTRTNVDLTRALCNAVRTSGKKIPIIFASSTQAVKDNPYGTSKREAEKIIETFSREIGSPVIIYRLPGVFGKWCRPDYNSVVATFCHNISRGLPVRMDDPAAALTLVYIDDVVSEIIGKLESGFKGCSSGNVAPEYTTTVGALNDALTAFRDGQTTLLIPPVGAGFLRALYSTYVSYLPVEKFVYDLKVFSDARGVFAEILKTEDSGQFSYFTAASGVTRGEHYHHSKTEKFLVARGKARFRYRHLATGETAEVHVSGERPQIVETIPGWAHEITNTGDTELLVLLWANEVFDREHPDTIACKV